MRELLNVLYVMTQGTMLHLDSDTVRVVVDGETKLKAPLLRLGGIVVMGRVSISPFLIQRCAEDGRSLVWLDRRGRFKARVEGPTRGNVLLRRAQHLALSHPDRPWLIARQIVAGKIQNSRQVLLRAAREAVDGEDSEALACAAERLAASSPVSRTATISIPCAARKERPPGRTSACSDTWSVSIVRRSRPMAGRGVRRATG